MKWLVPEYSLKETLSEMLLLCVALYVISLMLYRLSLTFRTLVNVGTLLLLRMVILLVSMAPIIDSPL